MPRTLWRWAGWFGSSSSFFAAMCVNASSPAGAEEEARSFTRVDLARAYPYVAQQQGP